MAGIFFLRDRFLFASPIAAAVMGFAAAAFGGTARTYCNPIDLPYLFESHADAGVPSYRDGADPTVVFDSGEYWLFASPCGVYFHSRDLLRWEPIVREGYPKNRTWAPCAARLGDRLALMGSGASVETENPSLGPWRKNGAMGGGADPDLFLDDDGRVYLFFEREPKPDFPWRSICGVELEPQTLHWKGKAVVVIPKLNPALHGWELDDRDEAASDEEIAARHTELWMEGPNMIKHNGRYYLQFAAPGTVTPRYADGVCVAERPLGPYRYAPYSPTASKPTGFIGSAGHGCTFREHDAPRFWRVSTMFIGVKSGTERRIGLFPAGFFPDGQLVNNTYLGDYPQLAPGLAADPLRDNLAGWMLLSLRKPAKASSVADPAHTPEKAFDENIRTGFSAKTGQAGEWLGVDFGKVCRINAVQVNFLDDRAERTDDAGDGPYRYRIEVSDDGSAWRTLADRSANGRIAPNEYIELETPVSARHARIVNIAMPNRARFSLSGLRFFGSGLGKPPEAVKNVRAERQKNRRLMKVSWEKAAGADFYVVRYGLAPDRLTLNRQVYGATEVMVPGLNTEAEYSVAVDAVNDTGITKGEPPRN